MNGGKLIAEVLAKHGVKFIFTLCGGHISPILVGAKEYDIRVIDVRHEVNAVFAADAVARLTGIPGVAAVTAGPGLTNTITAVKNAQMAQSPLLLIGGAAATALKGRGALQDIDQMALLRPLVKWAKTAKQIRQLPELVNEALYEAQRGVPGPVFLECPIDLLYDEELVREWYGVKSQGAGPQTLQGKVVSWYLKRHAANIFKGSENLQAPEPKVSPIPMHNGGQVRKAVKMLEGAERPVMVLGSQTLLNVNETEQVVQAVESLGIPVFLSGMARGMLGKDHPLQLRHKRSKALKETDLAILMGVPCDFRMNYGRHITSKAQYISVNRSREDLYKNRRPNLPILGDPGKFLQALSAVFSPTLNKWDAWLETLRERHDAREADIDQRAQAEYELLNPVKLYQELEKKLPDNVVLIADGGDFVATGSYVLQPRKPLHWLDPGAFGTLGVGAGFAIGAKLCYPDAEVWILYGDGTCAYSVAEYDTYTRHNLPIISVVGNDASWAQIARDQIEILKDDVATVLAYTDYDVVAKGYGGGGKKVRKIEDFIAAVDEAQQAAKEGKAYLINAEIAKTDFRKGSISM